MAGTPAPDVIVTGGALPPGLSLSQQGVLSGTPTTAGTHTFTVSAITSSGSAPFTDTIEVARANAAPTADVESYTTAEDTPLTITVPGLLGNDADVDNAAVTAQLVTQPAHGSVTVNADGSLT